MLLAALLLVQEPQLERLCREIVDGGIVAHVAHILDRLLGRANGLWIDLHQPLRERNGFGPQLLARDGAIDQPRALGDAAVEGLAGHGEPYGIPHPQRLDQRFADEPAGQNAPVDFRQTELGVFRRDRKIAGDQLGEAAAETEAIDHGDGRLCIGEELLPSPIVTGGSRPCALDRLVVEIAKEQFEVLPRAPGIARAGQDQNLRLWIVLKLVEDIAHVVMQLRTHRVALVGPVQDHPCNSILLLDLHGFVCARHASSASLVLTQRVDGTCRDGVVKA